MLNFNFLFCIQIKTSALDFSNSQVDIFTSALITEFISYISSKFKLLLSVMQQIDFSLLSFDL